MNQTVQNYLKDKRILITGASGYLASNLAKSLKDFPCAIRRLSRKQTLPSLQGTATFEDVCDDIRDSSVWDRVMNEVDVVFHFAAQTSVYVAAENPINDYQANVLPMLLMLETCRKNGRRADILFAGTSTEVGLQDKLPVNETFPDRPMTIYDTHKWMAEAYLKCYARQGLVKGVTLRLTNVYGPGPMSSSEDRSVLNMMTRKALSGEDLTLYGKGEFIRDYVYVEDVLGAFLVALTNMDRLNKKHFVLGSGDGSSIAEMMNLIAKQAAQKTGIEVKVDSVEPPPGLSPIESRNFIADSKSFSDITGWQPQYSLSEGIDRTIDALRMKDYK
jgi:nucleoside-diphosphate-sugar epimerase